MLRAEFIAVNRSCNSTKKPFMGIDHSTIGNVVIREDIRIDYDMLTQIYTLVSIRQGFLLAFNCMEDGIGYNPGTVRDIKMRSRSER